MKTTNPNYNPSALLNFAIQKLALKNDAALSHALEIAPPMVSKIRHKRIPLGASVLLKLHDLTDMPARELRKIAGMTS